MTSLTARFTSPTTIDVTYHGVGHLSDVQTSPRGTNHIETLHPGDTKTLTGVPSGVTKVKFFTPSGALEERTVEPLPTLG